jgi:hypothetical protein
LGSFEDWSRTVRDALVWLGEADPCGSMEYVRSQDPKLDALSAVLTHWRAVIGTARVSVRDVIGHATHTGTDIDDDTGADDDTEAHDDTGADDDTEAHDDIGAVSWGRRFRHPEFREALLTVAGEGGAINSRRLGKWLAANRDRIVAGGRIAQAGLIAGTMTWQLVVDG